MGAAEWERGWPGEFAAAVLALEGGIPVTVASVGDLDVVRPWASVSKLAVALAVGVEVDWGLHDYAEPAGPPGSTLAHLLSHSSGLALEEDGPRRGVGERRVYSNAGIDRAVTHIVGEAGDAREWLASRVFRPLGMSRTDLEDRPAAGVWGSTRDLTTLATAWLRSDGLALRTRDRIVTPFLPALDGIVPGFGSFRPCPWGLGPEVRGGKEHWMGQWPPTSFGHFGQSGALLLADVAAQVAVVATSDVPFGPWAVRRWPAWVDEARALARDR